MEYKVKIPRSMQERYEELKKHRDLMVNHDDILLICPDYYKMRMELLQEEFKPKEAVDKEFEEYYKNSELYVTIEDHNIIARVKDKKYTQLKTIFEAAVRSNINLCELVDYIGHYPNRYPIPNDDEKNPKFERMMEEYDISVRYYLDDDVDYMSISSDDITRIIEKMNTNFSIMDMVKNLTPIENYCSESYPNNVSEDYIEVIVKEILAFPPSKYQEQGKSKREEDRMHQKKFGWIEPKKNKEAK